MNAQTLPRTTRPGVGRTTGKRGPRLDEDTLRADVLAVLADELAAYPVAALSSFMIWDGGRRRLDGMSKGSRWDIDREQRRWEKASNSLLTEYRAAAKREKRRQRRVVSGPRRSARAWTREDDAFLRAHFGQGGSAAVAKALGRSRGAVRIRAHKLGATAKPKWSRAEDAMLREDWGRVRLEVLARRLRRAPRAVYRRAREQLGLSPGCPRGFVWLQKAADEAGYDITTLRRILAASGVRVHESQSPHKPGRRRCQHYVTPGEVRRAIAAWLDMECVGSAARARGLDADYLRAWLVEARAAGVAMPKRPGRRRRWRVPTKVIDRVVSDRLRVVRERRRLRVLQRSDPGRFESVSAGARRHGVPNNTLTYWLRAAGVPRAKPSKGGRPRLVEMAVIDQVVSARRQPPQPCEFESVSAGARRVGLAKSALFKRLRAAGAPREEGVRQWRVAKTVVDRVVADRKRRRS